MVKAPPQTMATGSTKVGIEKFLPTPMVQLSLAADGTLATPTEQELTDNPPVSLTPELMSYFENIREEFPQSTPVVPGHHSHSHISYLSIRVSRRRRILGNATIFHGRSGRSRDSQLCG